MIVQNVYQGDFWVLGYGENRIILYTTDKDARITVAELEMDNLTDEETELAETYVPCTLLGPNMIESRTPTDFYLES